MTSFISTNLEVFLVSKQQIVDQPFGLIYKYKLGRLLLVFKLEIVRPFDAIYKYKFGCFLVSKQQIVGSYDVICKYKFGSFFSL